MGETEVTGYPSRREALPAFDLAGFTRIVESGGEMFGEVRRDGRWETLRELAGSEGSIHGVASLDKECPKGRYRYSLCVRNPGGASLPDGLFTAHVKASEWVVFALRSFAEQYGRFWQDNPYELVKALGWEFNPAVGLHIDVFAPSFVSDADGMEFMMPVRRLARSRQSG